MTTEDTGDLIADTTTETTEATGTPPVDAPADATGDGATDAADLLSDDESGGSEGVPEKYTFEPPENLELSAEDLGKIEAFGEKAKEMGLSQKQYQSLIEYDLNRAQQMNEAAIADWTQRVDGWRDSARQDKEIGGEKLEASRAVAQQTLKQFGDPELMSLLRSPTPENPNGLAIGNHPAILRLLNRVGKAIADPSLLQGDAAPETEGTLKRMYPSMFDKSA